MGDVARPRAAATLLVVRDAPGGLEVLLLRRAEKGDHNSGAWVFPGGLLDAADSRCHECCAGLDDAAASAALGVDSGGLDFYVAAIRECFEEAGLLFAHDSHGALALLDGDGDGAAGLAAQRAPLARGEIDFADLCRRHGLRLATDRLHYMAHWLTPIGRAKRFDTRFFVAVLPPGQASAHDAVETLEHVWLRPAVALAAENTRRLMTPTRSTIEQIAAFADSAALLRWARSPRRVERVLPRLAIDAGGPRPVTPGDPAWHEIGRIDPDGRGDAWCALRPDTAVRLSPRVLRVAAGAGNSYLVGDGPGCVVIGPASAEPSHLDALLAAAPGRITRILPTDADDEQQRAAAAELCARLAADMAAAPADGDEITLGAGTRLQVIAAGDGRIAYLLTEEQTLFAADAATAQRIAAQRPERIDWLAPARGFLAALAPAAASTAASAELNR